MLAIPNYACGGRCSSGSMQRMGSFYCNATVIGSSVNEVVAALTGPAYVFADGDCVVVFSAADDEGMPVAGIELSQHLSSPVLSVGVHDDDILFLQLCRNGTAVIEGAVPDRAEYFGGEFAEVGIEGPPPLGATELVDALGRGDLAQLERALQEEFVFATERHAAVTTALGLPSGAVGWGYQYLSQDRESYDGPPLQEVSR